MLKFEGPARVFNPEEEALKAIIDQKSQGEVIMIDLKGRKEGPA